MHRLSRTIHRVFYFLFILPNASSAPSGLGLSYKKNIEEENFAHHSVHLVFFSVSHFAAVRADSRAKVNGRSPRETQGGFDFLFSFIPLFALKMQPLIQRAAPGQLQARRTPPRASHRLPFYFLLATLYYISSRRNLPCARLSPLLRHLYFWMTLGSAFHHLVHHLHPAFTESD